MNQAKKSEEAVTEAIGSALRSDACAHIFLCSAQMVGICLAVIGLMQIVTGLSRVQTLVDELLVVDALLFLASCFAAYLAMRMKEEKMRSLLRTADVTFLLGLAIMVVACGIIGFEIA